MRKQRIRGGLGGDDSSDSEDDDFGNLPPEMQEQVKEDGRYIAHAFDELRATF